MKKETKKETKKERNIKRETEVINENKLKEELSISDIYADMILRKIINYKYVEHDIIDFLDSGDLEQRLLLSIKKLKKFNKVVEKYMKDIPYYDVCKNSDINYTCKRETFEIMSFYCSFTSCLFVIKGELREIIKYYEKDDEELYNYFLHLHEILEKNLSKIKLIMDKIKITPMGDLTDIMKK